MTRRSTSARRTSLLALALAASAAVGGLPAAASAPPLERVVVAGPGAAEAVDAAGGRVLDALPLVGGVAALLPQGARVPALLSVTPDRPLAVQQTAASTGARLASTVRATLGLGAPAGEGRGVTVAVVDTGVADLPGLAGRLTHVAVPGVAPDGAPLDGLGHGTFIAGLVASDGGPAGPAYAGVAPAAHVLDVKVADAEGSTGLVDVLRGLQLAQAAGADVVNLSLSSESPLPSALDPLAVALDRLWADGTTVVVPSGNDPATVSSPGNDPRLLTVGGLAEGGTATRSDDVVATWSGRSGAKPDLVAPGQTLVSLLAPGSEAERSQRRQDLPVGHGVGSGTSFATAVVSGAAAALLGERDLSPGQVKGLVTGTAYRGGKPLAKAAGAGAGGLDLRAALAGKAPKDKDEGDEAVPGDLARWEAFVAAVLADDPAAAASSWSELSPQARQWAARQWAAADDDAKAWTARQWAARQWAASSWSQQELSARQWAARQWAARQWAAGDWSARQWAARQWAGGDWVARQWAARQWAGDDWSARQWAARQWAARQWSTRGWV